MGQVTVTLSGDEARLLRALDRVVAKEREVGQAGKDAAREHAKGHEALMASIDGVISRYTPWALAATAATAAINTLVAAHERMFQVREKAADRVERDADNLKKLSALAGGDMDRFQSLAGEARSASAAGGISVGAAAGQIFELERAGITGAGRVEALAQLGRAGIDPKALIAAKGLQKTFGGASSPQDLANVVGGIAGINQPGELGEFTEASAKLAPLAKRAGLSEQELLSDLAAVSGRAGSVEAGGHEFKKLLEEAAKHPRLGLGGVLRRGDGALLRSVGPGGLAAAQALQQAPFQVAQINGPGLLEGIGDTAMTDPAVRAAQGRAVAEAENNLSLEQQGIDVENVRGELLRKNTMRRKLGRGEFMNTVESLHEEAWAKIDPSVFMRIARSTEDTSRRIRPPMSDPSRDK